MSDLKVVTLHESNYRQAPETLRSIADGIEQGKWGPVGACVVVVLGNTLEVFGAGPDSDGPSVAIILQAGVAKIVNAFLEHGK